MAFEDLFRGDRALIRERQMDYVKLFAGRQDVLDVGCGRGEFLQLLKEHGISGRGVDLNHEMVAACQAAGLTFIGPPPAAIRAMGDKMAARRLALDLGPAIGPRPGPVPVPDRGQGQRVISVPHARWRNAAPRRPPPGPACAPRPRGAANPAA